MLTIDKTSYDSADFAAAFREMSAIGALADPEGQTYAACLRSAFDVVCLAIFMRERGGSLLLIHGDTPYATAKDLAVGAGCGHLIFGERHRIDRIGAPRSLRSGREPGLLQYSSGTTGEPKLVARSWSEVGREIEFYNRGTDFLPGERPLILVPVTHSFGLIAGVLSALERGAEPVVAEDRNPKFALHLLDRLPHSILYAVPFQLHLLDSLGGDRLRLRKSVVSGSPLTEALFRRLSDRSEELWQQYGCTETGCLSIGRPASATDVGSPLGHVELTIAEEEPAVGGGEIVAAVGGRVVNTRDVGYLDSSGSLRLLGRMDDLINVSGLKVLPAEVESVLSRMPGIEEAAVYRARHRVWGEAVAARIVASAPVDPGEIRRWCARYLPPYKVPSFIEQADEIPKLPNGKVSRKLLENGSDRERE